LTTAINTSTVVGRSRAAAGGRAPATAATNAVTAAERTRRIICDIKTSIVDFVIAATSFKGVF